MRNSGRWGTLIVAVGVAYSLTPACTTNVIVTVASAGNGGSASAAGKSGGSSSAAEAGTSDEPNAGDSNAGGEAAGAASGGSAGAGDDAGSSGAADSSAGSSRATGGSGAGGSSGAAGGGGAVGSSGSAGGGAAGSSGSSGGGETKAWFEAGAGVSCFPDSASYCGASVTFDCDKPPTYAGCKPATSFPYCCDLPCVHDVAEDDTFCPGPKVFIMCSVYGSSAPAKSCTSYGTTVNWYCCDP